MDRHSLHVLEFERILERLAGFARLAATRRRLAEPQFFDREGAEAVFDRLEAARDLLDRNGSPPFPALAELEPLLARLEPENAFLDPPDTRQVALWLEASGALKAYGSRDGAAPAPLAPLFQALWHAPRLAEAIFRSIDERGVVVDGASTELKRIRREMQETADRIQQHLQRLLNDSRHADHFQERLVTLRAGRYVVPLKANHAGKLRGIIHDRSASGETLFVEPEAVVELNNSRRTLALDEEREVTRILKDLASLVRQDLPALHETCSALGELDEAFARAQLARVWRACRPRFAERLDLRQARHPLLTAEPVPLDLALEEGSTMLVVTGPNTGGKTVTLKTAALFALVARAGLFLPCAEGSGIPFFSEVFCDIGDEQSIEQSLSTFSAHLIRLIEILAKADRESLVVIDEIGAGTDPQEGAALGIAILEELAARAVTTIVTTHYGAIKHFAYRTPGMMSASMAFDTENLLPTFRLLLGTPGASHAFAIARRYGLPEAILAEAERHLQPETRQADAMLADIGRDLDRAREKKRIAEAQAQLREELAEEYRRRLARLSERREAILAEARDRARDSLRQFEEEAARLLKQMEARATAPTAKETSEWKRALRNAAAAALEGQDDTELQDFPVATRVETEVTATEPAGGAGELVPGDIVVVPGLSRHGSVVTVRPNRVTVAIGSFRTTLPPDALQRVGHAEATVSTQATIDRPAHLPLQLDIRGMRADEAEESITRYIDEASLAGMPMVSILHGKGTGALSQATARVLGSHPLVRDHRFAVPEQGGFGVTVADIG